MTNEWYYAQEGTQRGPVTFACLQQFVVSGELTSNDLVWRDGMSEWKPVSTVPDLNVDVMPAKKAPPPLPHAAKAIEKAPSNCDSDSRSIASIPPFLPEELSNLLEQAIAKSVAPMVSNESRLPQKQQFENLYRTYGQLKTELRKSSVAGQLASELQLVGNQIDASVVQSQEVEQSLLDIEERLSKYNTLVDTQANLRGELSSTQSKLSGHFPEVGAAVLESRNGKINVACGDETQALLDACAETGNEIEKLKASMHQLGEAASGMFAKIKAKAEQGVLWGKIKFAQNQLSTQLKNLGNAVLISGDDSWLQVLSNSGEMKPVLDLRVALSQLTEQLRTNVKDLTAPEFRDFQNENARAATLLVALDSHMATQMNAYRHLASLIPKPHSDAVDEVLQEIESQLAELDRLSLEKQTKNLPSWIHHKFDTLEQQHIWSGSIDKVSRVELNLRRVKKETSERSYLVVVYNSSGQKMKIDNIPGRVGAGASALNISRGKSLVLRIGDNAIAFATTGRSQIRKSKQQLGNVSTEKITEEQLYQVSPDHLVRMASVSSEVPFRLQGNQDIEGKFDAERFGPRIREWCDTMQVQRLVARNQCKPEAVRADSPATDTTKSAGSVPGGPSSSTVAAVAAAGAAGLVAGAAASAFAGSGSRPPDENQDEELTNQEAHFANIDADGDGQLDTVLLDADGDGELDGIGRDRDGDGQVDTVLLDSDQDGNVEAVAFDSDRDGKIDSVLLDTDNDGEMDAVAFDSDEDGAFDTAMELDSEDDDFANSEDEDDADDDFDSDDDLEEDSGDYDDDDD